MKLRRQLLNTDGSSMISVLVAFIILLLGIAGFARAVRTSNDMIRRAEMLNTATGKVLESNFYPDYVSQPFVDTNLLNVYPADEDGVPTSTSEAFQIHGRLRQRTYTVTISEAGKTEDLDYQMFFYK